MENNFNPKKHISFSEGARKVNEALKEVEVDIRSRIFTSRDKEAIQLVNLLKVENIPNGFKKWQLPIVLENSQLFISIGQPDVDVPERYSLCKRKDFACLIIENDKIFV